MTILSDMNNGEFAGLRFTASMLVCITFAILVEECEKNHPWMEDEDFRDLFDRRMDYHQEVQDTDPLILLCKAIT
jgi:hypothetical protein